MANLRGTVQGFKLDGRPVAGKGSRLGHGSLETLAATWRTFATVYMWKDGRTEVNITRDGRAIHVARFDAEGK